MKKLLILINSFFLLSVIISGCNRDQPSPKVPEAVKMACYRSISGNDTAWLSIDTARKQITGPLKVNYATKMEIFQGTFNGKMYGDTLKGYFDFKINKGKESFRNPLAFLKTGDSMTMGIGQFKTVVGTAHFDEKVPIDYERARFVFTPHSCNLRQ